MRTADLEVSLSSRRSALYRRPAAPLGPYEKGQVQSAPQARACPQRHPALRVLVLVSRHPHLHVAPAQELQLHRFASFVI